MAITGSLNWHGIYVDMAYINITKVNSNVKWGQDNDGNNIKILAIEYDYNIYASEGDYMNNPTEPIQTKYRVRFSEQFLPTSDSVGLFEKCYNNLKSISPYETFGDS